jgi:hypothetical protein
MKSPTKNLVRKRPGRPATGQDPVTAIRLSGDMREAIDHWAAKQDDEPGRSEAIRRLIELGLANAQSARRLTDAKTHAAIAKKLAAELGLKAKSK